MSDDLQVFALFSEEQGADVEDAAAVTLITAVARRLVDEGEPVTLGSCRSQAAQAVDRTLRAIAEFQPPGDSP